MRQICRDWDFLHKRASSGLFTSSYKNVAGGGGRGIFATNNSKRRDCPTSPVPLLYDREDNYLVLALLFLTSAVNILGVVGCLHGRKVSVKKGGPWF